MNRSRYLLYVLVIGIPFGLSFLWVKPNAKTTNECISYVKKESMEKDALNIYGEPLGSCCTDPMTGFYRNGYCQTSRDDYGTHIACAVVTKEFLEYSKTQGNDLMSPNPNYHFPGLKPGDKWCLCITRWLKAVKEGVAPPLDLSATHQNALQYCNLELLQLYDVAKQN